MRRRELYRRQRTAASDTSCPIRYVFEGLSDSEADRILQAIFDFRGFIFRVFLKYQIANVSYFRSDFSTKGVSEGG